MCHKNKIVPDIYLKGINASHCTIKTHINPQHVYAKGFT
jgi:hypothetical protein